MALNRFESVYARSIIWLDSVRFVEAWVIPMEQITLLAMNTVDAGFVDAIP